jgi:hypothetical protein
MTGVGDGDGVGDGVGVGVPFGKGVGVGDGVGAGAATGSAHPAPHPRIVTLSPEDGKRMRVQLQLFVSLRSTKNPFGSAVTLSRYSPDGRWLTLIDW